jgi:hypothetical protein
MPQKLKKGLEIHLSQNKFIKLRENYIRVLQAGNSPAPPRDYIAIAKFFLGSYQREPEYFYFSKGYHL